MRGVNWNGRYLVTPQAASRVDTSGLQRVALGASGRLAILAEMTGLIEPKTIKTVGDPALAMALINPASEDARKAVEFAFDPSRGVQGAGEVHLIPVNPATQSAFTFADAAAADALVLTSYLYGLVANQIKAKIEDGTNSGKKVTVAFQDETESFDDIERKSFTIQYTGAGSAAGMSIDGSALATSVTGAAGDDLNLAFADYPTIQALADAIEATGKYDVTVETDKAKKELTADLDHVTAQDILSAPYTAKSDLQAIVDEVNKLSQYVAASKAAGADAAPDNKDWTYLAGGTDGATTNDDWQEAFDLLKTVKMDLVVPVSSDASIHAMGDSHCAYMSGMEGKSERRQFVGGAAQSWNSEANRTTAVDTLKSAAKALNSDRTVHVGFGGKDYNDDGDPTLYPGYIVAAMYAGIAAGSSVEEPLTRKSLRLLDLEVELRPSEIKDLITSGVAVPVPDEVAGAGFVISRQITTWLQDDNDYRIEFSVGRSSDYIAQQVRLRHQQIVGKPGQPAIDQSILNLTNAVLQAAKRDGIIVDFDPKKTVVRIDGSVRYVDYEADAVLPINWILSTYHPQSAVRTIQL